MKTELDHLPNRKQRDIALIRDVLLEEFDLFLDGKTGRKAHTRIVKIILFGSHARGGWVENPVNGYYSDYDILVIVSDRNVLESYEIWNAADDRLMRQIKPPVGLIIHTWQEICDALNRGEYFFKDIREQGIELYANGKKELPAPKNLTPQEAHAIADKFYKQWYDSAKEFMIDFQACLTRGSLLKAAFELHQATERFLACTLLVHTNYLPKTHNILHLRSLCAQIDPSFSEIFPEENKRQRRATQRLKCAYVDARYSMHYEITEEELDWLSQEVETLQALTKASCEAKLKALAGGKTSP